MDDVLNAVQQITMKYNNVKKSGQNPHNKKIINFHSDESLQTNI